MCNSKHKKLWGSIFTIVLFAVSGLAMAQDPPSACVEQGALAYDNWTKSDSGGTGELPDGAVDSDYVRCKACHGWDRMATEGGYARRSRNSGRSNAGAGDGDMTSRVISPVMGEHAPATADMIRHAGTGRAFSDGADSWVELDAGHSASNKAANANGYTLGNQHPDFTTGGANAMTQEQVDCLVEFLNFADADPDAYFDAIYPDVNPVVYSIKADADADAGETFYSSNCFGCHGDPATDHMGGNGGHPEGGILAYLAQDGKFSEFVHKGRWGIPDTIMSRGSISSPTSQDMRDMMLYLQDLGGTGLGMTGGHSGVWWDSTRSGEGFQVDIFANAEGDLIFVAFFYAYDDLGNQIFLVAAGEVMGDMVEVVVEITDSGLWGDAFDPNAVNRTPWGSGTFMVDGCDSMHVVLTPNADQMGNGFTEYVNDLERFSMPDGAVCP